MTPDRWTALQDLYLDALGVPDAAREPFVRDRAPDTALADEVLELLGAPAPTILDGRALDALGEGARDVLSDLAPGAEVGPYRVAEEVGRGGMGAVYRAERADGAFEQTVALKVVKRGMDSDAVLRRFRAERRILARLEHPGIARLIDGGLSDDGRPWLAMEFVEGEPITDYCDRRALGVDARLSLFRRACEAVEYAHRQLVVHRDLKPSNVLVTETPAGPRVKLLDFGIAKVLAGDAGDEPLTVLTAPGQPLLTPEYAAPEQVAGGPVSTATDVYALGVVLYELLTGRRPYTFGVRTPSVVEHVVRTVQPPRPSAAVEDASAHGATADRLRRQLAGDLDTICLMALRKEPERRYGSAQALADDLRRHQADLPVRARPDTVGYRARTFARRHRAGLAAAAAAVGAVVLVAALAFARVEAERDRARAEAARAEEVSDFLAALFTASDPAQSGGIDVSARALLAAGADRIGAELGDQPALQAEMLHVVGSVYQSVGEFERAEALLDQALALRRRHLGAGHPETAATLHALGFLYERQGRYAEAEAAQRVALAVYRAHAETHAEGLAETLHGLAHAHLRLGRYDEAERRIREAIRVKEEVYGARSPEVAYSLNVLGDVVNQSGRPDEAEAVHLAALDLRLATIGPDHLHTSNTYHNLAGVHRDQERWADAERRYRQALRIQRVHYDEPDVEIANTLSHLALVVGMQGRSEEAAALHDAALAGARQAGGAGHPRVAGVLIRRGTTLAEEGRYAEAEAVTREGIALWRRASGDTPHVPRWLARLAGLVAAQGRTGEAAALAREGRQLCDGVPDAARAACVDRADAVLVGLGESGATGP
jgi:serine/threonine-protein kinase